MTKNTLYANIQEKYIYLLMAYTLAKQNGGSVTIGHDNNMKGGQNYTRRFSIQEYKGKTLLTETKTTASFTDFSRTYEIIEDETYTIREYYNENNENCSVKWIH